MTEAEGRRTPEEPSMRLTQEDWASIFDSAPTSLWIQDLSALKTRLDEWRDAGVANLRAWLDEDASRIEELVGLVRLVTVNTETLRMYEVVDEADLFAHIRVIFGNDQIASFVEVICNLWAGALRTKIVTSNYTSKGRPFDVSYHGRLLPGHEEDWARYLISVEDVSSRESAFRQLELARTHDSLTGLHNRIFLIEEMERLESSHESIALAVIDLNGLKAANDRFGHKAGDDLLRQMGKLLSDHLPSKCQSARIGGDEFVVVMRGLEETDALSLLDALARDAEAANAESSQACLSFSIGIAWRMQGESMDSLLMRADHQMYESKRAFYDKAA